MKFINQLTSDTNEGVWDDTWNYKDGAKTYSFIKAKHPLSGLTISTAKSDTLMIFPNGFGIVCEKSELENLRTAILSAIERYVDKCTNDYTSNKMVVEEKGTEGEDKNEKISIDSKNRVASTD